MSPKEYFRPEQAEIKEGEYFGNPEKKDPLSYLASSASSGYTLQRGVDAVKAQMDRYNKKIEQNTATLDFLVGVPGIAPLTAERAENLTKETSEKLNKMSEDAMDKIGELDSPLDAEYYSEKVIFDKKKAEILLELAGDFSEHIDGELDKYLSGKGGGGLLTRAEGAINKRHEAFRKASDINQ